MYVGRDFHPNDVGESAEYSFDFARDLEDGDSIVSAAWSCWAEEGTDASASSRLSGSASVSGTKTTQRVDGLLADVKYGLQAIVTTTLGNTVSLFSYVKSQDPSE